MAKKGPLNKAEKFYIENNPDMGNEDIANDLNRSVQTVAKHREKFTDDKPNVRNVGDFMAKKEDRGVTIMTETASSVADDNKKAKVNASPKRYAGAIHKIKED